MKLAHGYPGMPPHGYQVGDLIPEASDGFTPLNWKMLGRWGVWAYFQNRTWLLVLGCFRGRVIQDNCLAFDSRK